MKAIDNSGLESGLAYRFTHPNLLNLALTHSSQALELEAAQGPEGGPVADNEQLEFLGDAVLALTTTEELFHRFPGFSEGELSKLRAHLVSERHLILVAKVLQMGRYLRLGRGEEKSGGRYKTALLVDAFEAVLGAVYLDGGMEPARRLVLQFVVTPELERIASNGENLPLADYKSALQERLQASGRLQPSYVLVREQGPEHSKVFTVEARLHGGTNGSASEFVGRAEGSTKKMAEQEAARQVLEHLATLPVVANARSKRKEGRSRS